MYTTAQQAFAFAQMMGSADSDTGTAEALANDLAAKVDGFLADQALIALMGDWSRVWGPAVWQAPGSDTMDNAIMVVRCASTSTYMVAVAGTNPKSMYDILTEDLEVNPLVPWSWGTGTGANIATGTSLGVTTLLGCADPATSTTVSTFLGSVDDASSSALIFCGHSLGGALAPVLALALFNSQGALDGAGWQPVAVAATAGPSPGDQGFVDLYVKTFPATGGLNTLTWNSLDIVPHAWASGTFTASILKGLYPKIKTSSCIGCIVDAAVADPPSPNPYVQLPNSGPFTGTFQNHPLDLDPTKAFLAEVLYQHIMGYYDELTPELVSILSPYNPYSFSGGRLVLDYLSGKVTKYCESKGGCS